MQGSFDGGEQEGGLVPAGGIELVLHVERAEARLLPLLSKSLNHWIVLSVFLHIYIYIYIYIYIFEQVKSTELHLFYQWFHMVF